MSKTALQQKIRVIRADRTAALSQRAQALYQALSENTDALTDVNASYRIKATDTGYAFAFALMNGTCSLLGQDAPATVTLLGKEKDLSGLLNGEVNPVTALLFGKLRIEGDKSALLRFSEFI